MHENHLIRYFVLVFLLLTLFITQTMAQQLNLTTTQSVKEAEQDDQRFNQILPYILERIDIKGNHNTEDEFIRRKLDVRMGELLNEEKVIISRLKLLNTGLFKSVNTSLKKGSEKGKVILVFQVEERGDIIVNDLFLGLNRRRDLFGGGGLATTNFLSKGLYLSASMVFGKSQQGYRLQFMDPEFTSNNLIFGLGLVYNNAVELAFEDISLAEVERLEYRRLGGLLSLGFRAGGFHRFYTDYRLEGLESHIKKKRTSGSVLPNDIYPGKSYLSTITFTYQRDSRNGQFLPSSGSRLNLSIELGTKLVASDYDFSKYFASFEKYYTVSHNHIITLRALGGLVQAQNKCPFFNKFFRGDYAFFSLDKYSLPRSLELNFTEVTDTIRYDDVLISGRMGYAVPLWLKGRYFYKGYAYGAVDVTHTGGVNDPFTIPLSFDIGLKMDTYIGVFTISTSYILDTIF